MAEILNAKGPSIRSAKLWNRVRCIKKYIMFLTNTTLPNFALNSGFIAIKGT